MAFFIGVDLGQASDYTAIVVVESLILPCIRTDVTTTDTMVSHDPVFRLPDGSESRQHPPVEFALRHIERITLGTSYPAIVARIGQIAMRTRGATLVVDATGVGRAIVDLLRTSGLDPYAITITAGENVSSDGMQYRVPKRDLVGAAQLLLQTRRLKIARSLPHVDLLVRELQNFKVKIDPRTAHDSYAAWREGDHDDLVLALTVALWMGERSPGLPYGFASGRSLFSDGPCF